MELGNPAVSRLLQAENSVLLIVDVQQKLLPAMPEPEKLLQKTATLVQACTQLKVPIVVSEQVPEKLGRTASELAHWLPLEAAVLSKTAFGCGQEPDILAFLDSLHRRQVILCGIETHVCVNQTAHQLLAESYQVHLITDATQSRHKKDQKTALIRMQQSGIIPSSTEAALFELLNTATHPLFKPLQALIK